MISQIKKKSIKKKVIKLLLSSVVWLLLLIGLVGAVCIYSLREISMESSSRLGRTAAGDAETALENMAGEQLYGLAVQRAAYIEEKFNAVEAGVAGIAALAENIYAHPEQYPDREVAWPVRGSNELAAQLLWSERLIADHSELPNVVPAYTEEVLKLGNIQDLLVQYNANNPMISSTYIASVSGWMIQADYIADSKYTGESPLPMYYEAAQRQWFQRGMEAGWREIVYSDVMMDVNEGGECIVCAMPVYYNGEIVAVAGIGSYLNTVSAAVRDTVIGESGYAFILNEKGNIMLSGVHEGETAVYADKNIDIRESENAMLADIAADMTEGGSGLKRLMVDGREVYLAYAPLTGLNWSFAVVMDVEEIIAPAKESEQKILMLAGETVIQQDEAIRQILLWAIPAMIPISMGISAAGIIFSRRMTGPLDLLTKKVVSMDGGNLDVQIDIHTGDEVEKLGNAFNHMAAKIREYVRNLEKVTEEKERIRAELVVASSLQSNMLPSAESELEGIKEVELWAEMTPAKEVGGDFYDFFPVDDSHLAVVMADVSGKGVPAALFMVVARTLLRSHINSGIDVAEAVENVNRRLCENNKDGMFVTAWIGVLDLTDGRLVYVNAGHNAPLILRNHREYEYLNDRSGLVLAAMDDEEYRPYELYMRRDDILFLYTDGVTEAHNIHNELYGEERLLECLNQSVTEEPKEILENVWDDLLLFREGAEQFDDITELCLRYRGKKYKEKSGKPDIHEITNMTAFVRNTLKEYEIPKDTAVKMLLALDEIYSNICYYSYAEEVTVGVGVTQNAENTEVFLTFTDDGIPYDPLQKKDPNVAEKLKEGKEGGWGIFLVKKRMDRMEYKYIGEKNCLSIYKVLEA